ncbi:MAG: hypothetical protein Q8K30_04495 [Candidatus Gracilibacteria bacterium]|nr:hypothetical protein [Candidatus Gracilibacteria bacterium]
MQKNNELNIMDLINNKIISVDGVGEKITQDISILVKYTKDCCFNCCNKEGLEGPDKYKYVTCVHPNSHFKGLDLVAELPACDRFDPL